MLAEKKTLISFQKQCNHVIHVSRWCELNSLVKQSFSHKKTAVIGLGSAFWAGKDIFLYSNCIDIIQTRCVRGHCVPYFGLFSELHRTFHNRLIFFQLGKNHCWSRQAIFFINLLRQHTCIIISNGKAFFKPLWKIGFCQCSKIDHVSEILSRVVAVVFGFGFCLFSHSDTNCLQRCYIFMFREKLFNISWSNKNSLKKVDFLYG